MNRILTVVAFVLWMPMLSAADLNRGTQAFENADYNSARFELEPLAEAGDAKAQMLVGVMHATGNGYQQDYVQAYKWLSLSSRAGNSDAQQASQRIAARMTRAQLRDAQAQADRFRPTPLVRSSAASSWGPPPQDLPTGRALVAEIQSGLNRIGYEVGGADGLMGRRTSSAIADFQRQVGVHADGKASQNVLLAIRKAESEGLRASTPAPSASTLAVPAASTWYFSEQSLDGVMQSLRRLLGSNDNKALRNGVTSLVQRSDWPWTDVVFRDDFKNRAGQGGQDWQVTRGEFAIRDGLLSDARVASAAPPTASRKRSGKEEVLGILGALLGAQIEHNQAAPQRSAAQARAAPDEVRLSAATSGPFLMRARVRVHDASQGTSFALQRTSQGATEELRLRYDTGAQRLLLEHASSRGVRSIAAVALRLDAGRDYNLEWARIKNGQMQVALNGRLVINNASIKMRGGFDTFAWRNHGGSYLLSEVEMHTRHRR